MKIAVKTTKPRNPLIAHAHFRRAGSHHRGGNALRQQSGRALRREIDQLHRSKDSP